MEENISAFAYKVGKELEKLVEERNNNLTEQLTSLQASVLSFRREIETTNNENMLKVYDMYFKIKEVRNGKIL